MQLSRRPRGCAHAADDDTQVAAVIARWILSTQGHGCGPQSIQHYLRRELPTHLRWH
jgi:hypothetical protein